MTLLLSQPETLKQMIQHFERWRADIAADVLRSKSLRQP